MHDPFSSVLHLPSVHAIAVGGTKAESCAIGWFKTGHTLYQYIYWPYTISILAIHYINFIVQRLINIL